MLVVGAKGFAKEVLGILYQLNLCENLVFYDDVNKYETPVLFDKFLILTSIESAKTYFDSVDDKFTVGLGNPRLRKLVTDKFIALGGTYVSTISPGANLGTFDVSIGEGSNILPGANFSNSTRLGKGCLVYYNAIITHDCVVGNYVQISPGATLLGRCRIGDYSQIGANATVLPDIKIGKNVIIGAGAVVTKDISDNCIVAGVPATIIKSLTPLEF